MKYIKAAIILTLVLWVATAPIARGSTPGSFLYRVNVVVNEPVWEWVHITQAGRADTVEQQLNARYYELASAWASKDSRQIAWAKKAEAVTAGRVRARLESALRSKDFKAADTLASHAQAITRAHRQVLRALAVKPGVGNKLEDAAFLDERLQFFDDSRKTIALQFTRAYERTGLVKGIDEKLNSLERSIATADNALTLYSSALNDQQRRSLQNTLARAQKLTARAKDDLGRDQYAASYMGANVAQGYALEVEIVIDGIRLYEIPALPTITEQE